MGRLRFLPAIILLLTGCGSATWFGSGTRAVRVQDGASVDEILKWLPVDTEAVFVARGPLALPSDPEFWLNTPPPAVHTDLLMWDNFLLTEIREGLLLELLEGKGVLLAVTGSRHFRPPPHSEGLMSYDGLHVLLFEGDHGLHEWQLREEATDFLTVEGYGVLVFEETIAGAPWTTFVAVPRSDLLLLATDKESLQEGLERITLGGSGRALPSDLREWDWVDTEAQIWAVRHFNKTVSPLDPTSPLIEFGFLPIENAIGMTFSYNPEQPEFATLHYVAWNPHLIDSLQEWRDLGPNTTTTLRTLESGVVRIDVHLSELDKTRSHFPFILMCFLGHAVYI